MECDLRITTKMKNDLNANAIIMSGTNIESSIEIPPVLIIEAGWWRVFHQSTENFTIGKFIEPAIARSAAGRLPLSFFSNAFDKAM